MATQRERSSLVIRMAEHQDNNSLFDFRVSQFSTAKQFKLVKPQMLSAITGYNYIVEHNDEIVATMQAERILEKRDFAHQSGTCFLTTEPAEDSFPTMYLSKAGTVSNFRSMGINSYMRLLILKEINRNTTIQSISGVGFENSPRLNLLRKLGYSFMEISISKDDYTRPMGKTYFMNLSRSSFAKAIRILERETSQLTQQFKIAVS